MPMGESFQNLVGYCFPCCDPSRDEIDDDYPCQQQERRDRMNDSTLRSHSRTVSWASFFPSTGRCDNIPEINVRQSGQSVRSRSARSSQNNSMREVENRQSILSIPSVRTEIDVRQSYLSVPSVTGGVDRQSVQSFHSARSLSTIGSLGMSPEILQSPRFAVSVFSSARISTEQPRIVDVQTPTRPRRARANTMPVSPNSLPSPLRYGGPSPIREVSFIEDVPSPISPRFNPVLAADNAPRRSDSIASQRRRTIGVCNFSRPTVQFQHDSMVSRMEEDWGGRSPIRRLPSLISTAPEDPESLMVNREFMVVSPVPSSLSSNSHTSEWAFQPLCARPAQSTATATPTEVFSPASDVATPLTAPDRQPVAQVSTEASGAENSVRRRKIIQALEEKSILERRLIELEKMIASRRAEADRTIANLLSDSEDGEPRSIDGTVTDLETDGSDDASQEGSQSTDVAAEESQTSSTESVPLTPPSPPYVPRTTEDGGIPIVGASNGPLGLRRQRRPHLTRLQIDTTPGVTPRLVNHVRAATDPFPALVSEPVEPQRTPATAGAISSAVSRISNWIFGGEEEYVRVRTRAPSFGGYAARSSPHGNQHFVQAHHISPSSPFMTAAAISAILRGHPPPPPREQNPEDIIARDPAPPYQEVDPNPSPSFASVISGASPQPSPALISYRAAIDRLNFESQRQTVAVL